ncbi:Ltp family lipoprotein [Ornithinimicrobium sp. Y1847]
MDGLDVDYNEQAAKSAQQYLEFTGFSRSGLIDQLMFEGYT